MHPRSIITPHRSHPWQQVGVIRVKAKQDQSTISCIIPLSARNSAPASNAAVAPNTAEKITALRPAPPRTTGATSARASRAALIDRRNSACGRIGIDRQDVFSTKSSIFAPRPADAHIRHRAVVVCPSGPRPVFPCRCIDSPSVPCASFTRIIGTESIEQRRARLCRLGQVAVFHFYCFPKFQMIFHYRFS